MGDVGSGFLGYSIAVLALAAARTDPVALWVWAILGALFIADSGVTLVRRVLRRARLHEAHRTHAYQLLARRWQSHRRVTLAFLLGNLLWLLPCALAAVLRPDLAGYCALAAFLPPILIAVLLGAGRES
jgi:Fuc2NAc and GlcNAc transferase